MTGRLYYHGTAVEVKLGDRVTVKRFFRSPKSGVVCYLPGSSPPHPEMRDDDGSEDWAIELEDGTLLVWPYVPAQLQPSRTIRFRERAEPGYKGLQPVKKLGLVSEVE